MFMSPEIELSKYFEGPKHGGAGAVCGLDEEDVEFIQSVLQRARLCPPISVDRERLKDSHEGWVYVIVSGDETADNSLSLFSHFSPYPRAGVLTWANSD